MILRSIDGNSKLAIYQVSNEVKTIKCMLEPNEHVVCVQALCDGLGNCLCHGYELEIDMGGMLGDGT